MKANSAHRLLPFRTFGEAAAFDLEVGVGSFAQAAARHSTCTLATDPVRRGRSASGRSPKPPTALARLHAATAGLGEAHRVQAAAGNDEPIPFHRVGDARWKSLGDLGAVKAVVVGCLAGSILQAHHRR